MQLIHVIACYDFPSLPPAVKKMFIEDRGQTLMLSRDCGTPVEVINIKQT